MIMLITINDQWRIRSESRAWAVQRARKDGDTWASIAWYDALDQVARYLRKNGVSSEDLEAVAQRFECHDLFSEDGTRPFCWRFDYLFPPDSPEADFLADKSILERYGRAPNVLQPAFTPDEGEKAPLPKRIQPESGSPNDGVIQVNDSWRIRPVQGDWNIERLRDCTPKRRPGRLRPTVGPCWTR